MCCYCCCCYCFCLDRLQKHLDFAHNSSYFKPNLKSEETNPIHVLLGGLDSVWGAVCVCVCVCVCVLATRENLPSKWSMPDPRGGPQNAVLCPVGETRPPGSAGLTKQIVCINITEAAARSPSRAEGHLLFSSSSARHTPALNDRQRTLSFSIRHSSATTGALKKNHVREVGVKLKNTFNVSAC